jgi:hypothetical protein
LVNFGESATADEASVFVRQANAAGAVHAGFFFPDEETLSNVSTYNQATGSSE